MRKNLGIALGSSLIGLALVVACGGHESSDVLGAPGPIESGSSTSSSGTSGTSTSGSSGASTSSSTGGTSTSSSSGGPICACAQPPAGCISTGGNEKPPCKCAFTCPDGGGAVTCEYGKPDQCPGDSYCDASNCQKGVCVARGTGESITRNPVCGCDGTTYWNDAVAANVGMAVASTGACSDVAATKCGGAIGTTCAAGESCNRSLANKNKCGGIIAAAGTCWHLPVQCPIRPATAHPCGAGGCIDNCTAIRKSVEYFEDGSCN